MIDKENFEKLQIAVLERLTKNLSIEKGTDKFVKEICRIAVMASIITLEEYEKLNQ